MHRLIDVVVLAGATLSAATLVADSGATATPVEAENGSSYEVGAVLEFDVPKDEGEYDLLIDGDWMATRAASGGTLIVDTSGRGAGTYELTDADSQETIYEIELDDGEEATATPSPSPTRTPSPTSTPTHSPTHTPTATATAQHDRAGTDSAASRGAGNTTITATDPPSSRPTTVTDETTPTPEEEPTDPADERPDRTTTTAPGFGPVVALTAVAAALVALRRGEH